MATLRAYGKYNPWTVYPREGDRCVVLLLEWFGDMWAPRACYSVPWACGTAIGALWENGLWLSDLTDAYDMVPVPEHEALALVGW